LAEWVYQCSAELAAADTATTWTMRTSLPEYVIAIVTIVGSILFAVCASSLHIASQEALNTWAGMEKNFISELFELLFSFGF
jgi:hypothetical protein